MEELPHIITDLAMILIVAGVVTIIFKRLKQPLVLGYIVAGFLAGPHMPYTPTVDDMTSVNIWSQIGVVFMMFALGLEFSFKKIVKMGMSPVIAALSVMTCMISVGCGVGTLFGWSSMDCLFLGGMLAMSSTTIIYKAFDDLGIRNKKFAGGVMSVLILEDILGILLMVVLSAVAVSRSFEGGQLIISLLQLGFFLLLWFVVGIFIVPLFLKKNSKFINGETLLIVSVGFCFAMVVLASNVGYSPAFGAFMMGSIMAETVEAERIEHVIGSVKDLFGAIFFVSVGMLVDPSILVEYWLPILAITVAILLGQSILGTMSFILSGQGLQSGMQSGFSMAQIGEFAFIIAALGESKGVTSNFLYPVVVAVSIVTTFLTPYMIKAALPAYNMMERLMPQSIKNFIERHASMEEESKVEEKEGVRYVWRRLLLALLRQVVVYFTISLAIITLSTSLLQFTFISLFGNLWGEIVFGVVTLLLLSPFLRAIVIRKNNSEEAKYINTKGLVHKLLLWLTIVIRSMLATFMIWYVVHTAYPMESWLGMLVSVVILFLICTSKFIKLKSIKIERTFRQNLTRRERLSKLNNQGPAYARRLQGSDLHIARLTLPDNSEWGGKSLMQLQLGRTDNILVATILRGNLRINIPTGNDLVFPRDVLEVVGDDASIEQLSKRMETEVIEELETESSELQLKKVVIEAESPYLGLTLKESGIRAEHNCMVIGFEEEDGSLSIASADHIFQRGDKMWIAFYNSQFIIHNS